MTDCVLSCLYGGLKDSCCLVWGNCKFHCVPLSGGRSKRYKENSPWKDKNQNGDVCSSLFFFINYFHNKSMFFTTALTKYL